MHSTFSFCSCPILIIALFFYSSQNSRLRSFHFNEFSIACDKFTQQVCLPYFAAQRLAFHISFEKFLSFFLSIKCLTSIQNRINCFGKKLRPKKLKLLSQNVFFFVFNLNKISNFMNHGHFFFLKNFFYFKRYSCAREDDAILTRANHNFFLSF